MRSGYSLEGTEWTWLAPNNPAGIPLYCLHRGTHYFYTTSTSDRDAKIAAGYADEGIACVVLSAPGLGTELLYRCHNPQIDDFLYSTDSSIVTAPPSGNLLATL